MLTIRYIKNLSGEILVLKCERITTMSCDLLLCGNMSCLSRLHGNNSIKKVTWKGIFERICKIRNTGL